MNEVDNRTISVIGLGYVGLPVAVAFGETSKQKKMMKSKSGSQIKKPQIANHMAIFLEKGLSSLSYTQEEFDWLFVENEIQRRYNGNE